MANIAVKRILRDIKNCQGELDSEHIYIIPDEEDIYHVKAMILGPEDTPYAKGYYFFDVNFPKTYPHDPPKVLFMTLNNEIRFNPNLYKCGKVCLSILGTWSGPQWTSCITLKTILFSIQSLLNENPLQNEPGYENCIDEKAKIYRDVVEYYNVKVAIIQMMNFTPNGFEGFKPVMNNYFLKNFGGFNEYVMKNINNKTKILSRIYSLAVYPEYTILADKLNSIKQKILSEQSSVTDISEAEAQVTSIEGAVTNIKAKTKKKCPNSPAKNFEEGFVKQSEHDGRLYMVKTIKSGIKRWVINKS
jgi:ubiquitin-conjugating enzyme E2 Z